MRTSKDKGKEGESNALLDELDGALALWVDQRVRRNSARAKACPVQRCPSSTHAGHHEHSAGASMGHSRLIEDLLHLSHAVVVASEVSQPRRPSTRGVAKISQGQTRPPREKSSDPQTPLLVVGEYLEDKQFSVRQRLCLLAYSLGFAVHRSTLVTELSEVAINTNRTLDKSCGPSLIRTFRMTQHRRKIKT